jgi:peptidoglycan/xylan/chitin deacetylase (PgdA/CDA1 family)
VLKRLALATLAQPALGRLLASVRKERCAVFMLHRFASPEGKADGHSALRLRALLEYVRQAGIEVVSLDDLVTRQLATGGAREPRSACIAFTVDDGYRDFAQVGLTAFEAFDCPVTLFVVPGIIDSGTWFWWDQVEMAYAAVTAHTMRYELGGEHVVASWQNAAERGAAQSAMLYRLKAVPDSERRAFMSSLSALMGVDIPASAPDGYQVLGWDELRAIERRGVRIGPHTMTHPVLSRCTDDVARHEIIGSAQRVTKELGNPSRVFCYPNGRTGDFGPREFALLESTGMAAAVTAEPGIFTSKHTNDDGVSRWTIPRFNYEEAAGRTARLLLL